MEAPFKDPKSIVNESQVDIAVLQTGPPSLQVIELGPTLRFVLHCDILGRGGVTPDSRGGYARLLKNVKRRIPASHIVLYSS